MASKSTTGEGGDDYNIPPPIDPGSVGAAAPWPPPEHRSRAAEFYGFVAWTTTYILFVVYILWALLPDEWIVNLGVTWYPNRSVSCLYDQASVLTAKHSGNGPSSSRLGLLWL